VLKKIILIFLIINYLLLSANSINAADHNIKLKALVKQITVVKSDISAKEKQQVSVEQQLKVLKGKIAVLENDYLITIKNLKKQKKIFLLLNNDQIKQRQKLQEAQQKFSTQIITAYQIEGPDYLEIVFAKDNVTDQEVFLEYHRYIFVARLEQMHNIKKTLERININKQKILKQTKILENLENKQQQQKNDLANAQQERNVLLGSLKNKIASQNQKLKKLINAKKNLEKLIAKLSQTSFSPAHKKTAAISSALMTRLCKNFVWPTKGPITIHFGSPIEQSSWSWNGIIIAAPANQEIRAISSGQVAYSGWFNGYGMLLIIDHGSGYMSLYGNIGSSHKKNSDIVKAGEVIATTGKIDNENPGFYFSIRYNGRPVNPEAWCKSG
jgi:murein hydrolase activator